MAAATAGAGPKKKAKRQPGMKRGFFGRSKDKPRAADSSPSPPRPSRPAPPKISANERAAHKLMLEGAQKRQARTPEEQKIASTWKKAYWDRFTSLLAETPPDLSALLSSLKELRGRLIALTPAREDLAREAEAKIDLEHIEQMADNGAFGIAELSGVLEYLVSRLRALEAPAENAATDAWMAEVGQELAGMAEGEQWGSPLLPKAFAYISEKLDTIAQQSAESKVNMLSSYLAQHGAECTLAPPLRNLPPGLAL